MNLREMEPVICQFIIIRIDCFEKVHVQEGDANDAPYDAGIFFLSLSLSLAYH